MSMPRPKNKKRNRDRKDPVLESRYEDGYRDGILYAIELLDEASREPWQSAYRLAFELIVRLQKQT